MKPISERAAAVTIIGLPASPSRADLIGRAWMGWNWMGLDLLRPPAANPVARLLGAARVRAWAHLRPAANRGPGGPSRSNCLANQNGRRRNPLATGGPLHRSLRSESAQLTRLPFQFIPPPLPLAGLRRLCGSLAALRPIDWRRPIDRPARICGRRASPNSERQDKFQCSLRRPASHDCAHGRRCANNLPARRERAIRAKSMSCRARFCPIVSIRASCRAPSKIETSSASWLMSSRALGRSVTFRAHLASRDGRAVARPNERTSSAASRHRLQSKLLGLRPCSRTSLRAHLHGPPPSICASRKQTRRHNLQVGDKFPPSLRSPYSVVGAKSLPRLQTLSDGCQLNKR